MAVINWPAGLPQQPASYSEQLDDGVTIRTQPDNGPAKVRRRFSKGTTTAQMDFVLTLAQYAILEEFWKTTLNYGTQFFNFYHPWYGTYRDYRIKKTIKYGAEGTLAVRASMEAEVW